MSETVTVKGDEAFTALAKAIGKSADKKALRGELRNGLRRAARPTEREVKTNARSMLPKRGGLNRWVARVTVKTSIKTTGSGVGAELKAGLDKRNGKADAKRINSGLVAHKTFGRPPWHPQAVAPGFFDKALEGPTADRLYREVDKVITDLGRKVFG